MVWRFIASCNVRSKAVNSPAMIDDLDSDEDVLPDDDVLANGNVIVDPNTGEVTIEPEPERPMRYRCAGWRRKDEDGNKTCDYKAYYSWHGACPKCRYWFNCEKIGRDESAIKQTLATAADAKPMHYISTGIPEFDRVLGGGIVRGCGVLLGGDPGAGKTSMLLAVAGHVAKENFKVLYASAEQNNKVLEQHAGRLGIRNQHIILMGGKADADEIVEAAKQVKAKLVIADSVNMMTREDSDASEGSVASVNTVSILFETFANDTNRAVIMVGQINATGEFAGGMKLQHTVDTLCYLEDRSKRPPLYTKGEKKGQPIEGCEKLRELSIAGKNRNGDTSVREYLEMTAEGLKPLSRTLLRKLSRLELVD